MNRLIKTSSDGSHTIYNAETDEHYHSIFGAYTESKHIFIENGLNRSKANPVKVLEIGFGTGLNAFLTSIEGFKSNKKIIYEGIEMNPLEPEIVQSLNYPAIINPSYTQLFIQLHESKWNETLELTPNFSFKKILGDATKIRLSSGFDVVYFDAFSPEKQPELWSERVFNKIYKAMNQNGILTTYCAKGSVKRLLKSVGFKIELLSGPPGKRHMIMAIKL